MGVDIYLNGGFLGAKISKPTITDAIQAVKNRGFNTSADSRDDCVIKYTIKNKNIEPGSDQYRISGHSRALNEILDKVEENHELEIPIYYSSSCFKISFYFGTTIADSDINVLIKGPDDWWFDTESEDETAVTDRCDSTVDLVATLATTVDPEVGFTTLYNDHSTGKEVVGTETPSDHQSNSGWKCLEALPWVLVLGEEWIKAYGGRKQVRKTPGVDVTELETGHIVVRSAPNPASMVGGTTGESFEYLFGEDACN